jgi:hypothetical protein
VHSVLFYELEYCTELDLPEIWPVDKIFIASTSLTEFSGVRHQWLVSILLGRRDLIFIGREFGMPALLL